MAKRRGKTRQRTRRTVDGRRARVRERVRNWAELRLRAAFGLPDLVANRGAKLVSTFANIEASAYLRRVLQEEAELDPELYCCSSVSSNDNEDEF